VDGISSKFVGGITAQSSGRRQKLLQQTNDFASRRYSAGNAPLSNAGYINYDDQEGTTLDDSTMNGIGANGNQSLG